MTDAQNAEREFDGATLREWTDETDPRATLSNYGRELWEQRNALAAQILREREAWKKITCPIHGEYEPVVICSACHNAQCLEVDRYIDELKDRDQLREELNQAKRDIVAICGDEDHGTVVYVEGLIVECDKLREELEQYKREVKCLRGAVICGGQDRVDDFIKVSNLYSIVSVARDQLRAELAAIREAWLTLRGLHSDKSVGNFGRAIKTMNDSCGIDADGKKLCRIDAEEGESNDR